MMKKLVHGGDIYTAMERGKKRDQILDYSANINPLGIPEGVKKAVCRALESCENYPDPLCRKLARAVSGKEGVQEDHLIFGNGAADLIFRLTVALNPKKALVLAPTFAEYETALTAAGCETLHYQLREEDGFGLRKDFFSSLTEELDLIFLCNPNNPTGRLIEPGFMKQILDVCEEKKILAVVDECFIDFLEEPEKITVKDRTANSSYLFILRAFTKNYAMPGLRLGYGICGNQDLLGRLFETGQPWSVSLPAQEAGIAALSENVYLRDARSLIFREREKLAAFLKGLGFRVFPPAANYIFFRLPDGNDAAYKREFAADMAEEGILIRSCANYRGLEEGYFRIAVRKEEENRRLMEALDRRERRWQKQL